MFVIINVAYFCYGGGYAVIRDAKVATSVACPWPFPEAKVYDPNGYYRRTVSRGHIRRHLVGLGERTAQRETWHRPSTPPNRCGGGNG